MAGTGALCVAIAAPAVGEADLRISPRRLEGGRISGELLKKTAHVRQVFDVTAINDGKFLNNIKNSLNGLEFGFGIALKQVQIIAALHGAANMINYDDSMWAKYHIGEWLAVNDPETGRPASRSVFYPSKICEVIRSEGDPSEEKSSYQDKSVQGLQRRGVKFLTCHTATEEQAKTIVGG